MPLLVAATLLAVAVSALPALRRNQASARDQVRLGALFEVNRALSAYQREHGEPLPHVPDPLAGGWETSRDGCFLDALVRDGYLAQSRLDPLNDSVHQYRYHRYEAGEYDSPAPFYVLALTAFERSDATGYLPADAPHTERGGRDWSLEFPLALSGP